MQAQKNGAFTELPESNVTFITKKFDSYIYFSLFLSKLDISFILLDNGEYFFCRKYI